VLGDDPASVSDSVKEEELPEAMDVLLDRVLCGCSRKRACG